jgi:hypothetical protein
MSWSFEALSASTGQLKKASRQALFNKWDSAIRQKQMEGVCDRIDGLIDLFGQPGTSRALRLKTSGHLPDTKDGTGNLKIELESMPIIAEEPPLVVMLQDDPPTVAIIPREPAPAVSSGELVH